MRFTELQKAFNAGYKNPEAQPEEINESAFDKLSLTEAKQALVDGQRKRKNSNKFENNSLVN
jgi:hypothetical protein